MSDTGEERWVAIPGLDGYEASDRGRVRSLRRPAKPRVLKPCPNSKGYLTVYLAIGEGGRGNQKSFLVHELVLLTFVGPRPPGQWGRFKGERADTRPENLFWGDHPDTRSFGERNGSSKLTPVAVDEIRVELEEGRPTYAIARERGVTGSAVCDIKNGKTWSRRRDRTSEDRPMPRGKRRTQPNNDHFKVGDLAPVTDALNAVVGALEDLGANEALEVLSLATKMIGVRASPPLLDVSLAIPPMTPRDIRQAALSLSRVPIAPSSSVVDDDDDDEPAARSQSGTKDVFERAIRKSHSAAQGRRTVLDRQKETVEFVKLSGRISKGDVAKKFGIGESAAYQRLVNLAAKGLVNHVATDAWEATEKA